MKSAFIAYRHTGEDPRKLEPMLGAVRDELGRMGIEAYCTFFDEDDFRARQLSARGIMQHAFETIASKDLLFVIQATNDKSEGMLMEVGRFFGIKPIIVATHSDVKGTYVPQMADISYQWHTVNELVEGVGPSVYQLDA